MKELWIKYNGYIFYIVMLCIAFFLGAFVYEATAQIFIEYDPISDIETLSNQQIDRYGIEGSYIHIPPFEVDNTTIQVDTYVTPHGDEGYLIKIIDLEKNVLYQKVYGSERDKRSGVFENYDGVRGDLVHTDIDAYLSGYRLP